MPRDFKKRGRGRRGEEKEKKEKVLDQLRTRAEEQERQPGERPAKRQRLSPQADDFQEQHGDVVLDQPADGGKSFAFHAGQRTHEVLDASAQQNEQENLRGESQFFGHLDDGEQAFLKSLDLILANNSYESPDDKPLFLANAWKECAGKEMKIACSQSCSRVLERLIKASEKRQLKGAWMRMQGNFTTLVQHRFASHVVEALLLSSAPAVSKELLGEDAESEGKEGEESGAEEKDVYEDSEAVALQKSMEDYYLETAAELQENLGYLMTDQFASHALRVLLLALSGRPLAGTGAVVLLQSKKKERIVPKDEADAALYQQRVVPESFNAAVNNMISGTLAGLDTNYVRALATNPLANPVLQLFLELEFALAGKQKARDENSLYRRLLPDDPPSEGSQSAGFIKGLLFDPVGSRLLETIIQCAPGKTFKVIYKGLLRDQLNSMVRNEVAGFVVVKILERLSHDELEHALEQILPQIDVLFERCRHSIVKCMVERCRVRDVGTESLAKSVSDVFGGPGPGLLSKLLQPGIVADQGGVGDMSAERRALLFEQQQQQMQLDIRKPSKLHASVLAQTMLASQDALQEVILSSLVGSDADFLSQLARDRTATHVLQAALKPTIIDKNQRRQIVQKLLSGSGVIVELATDRVGSHVVDALVGGTAGLQFLRERVAEELARGEQQIRESEGRAVWRNWMMNLYQWKRGDWTARMKEQDQVQQAEGTVSTAAEGKKPVMENGGAKRATNGRQTQRGRSQRHSFVTNTKAADEASGPKSGIEAARARFAAQQRKRGGGGGGPGRMHVSRQMVEQVTT